MWFTIKSRFPVCVNREAVKRERLLLICGGHHAEIAVDEHIIEE